MNLVSGWCLDNLVDLGIGARTPEHQAPHSPPYVPPATYLQVFLAGSFSGTINAAVTTPMELVKCRLQASTSTNVSKGPGWPANSKLQHKWGGRTADVIRDVIHKSGPRGLYRGAAVTILRDGPGYGAYFAAFDMVVDVLGGRWRGWLGDGLHHDTSYSTDDVATWQIVLAGGFAGVVGWAVTYPLDVVKTRIQSTYVPDGHGTRQGHRVQGTGVLSMIRTIYSTEGIRSFFAGLSPTLIRAVPVNAATFYGEREILRGPVTTGTSSVISFHELEVTNRFHTTMEDIVKTKKKSKSKAEEMPEEIIAEKPEKVKGKRKRSEKTDDRESNTDPVAAENVPEEEGSSPVKKKAKKAKKISSEAEPVAETQEGDGVSEPVDPLSLAAQPLSDALKRRLVERGIEKLFPIQAATISHIVAGKDVVGRARTGTGKTLAFALPIIQVLWEQGFGTDLSPRRHPKVLVMTPTRELCIQVAKEFESISGHAKVLSVYGGVAYDPQNAALRGGVDVVVGTPGRLFDMMERGTLALDNLRFVVLDEADQMLDVGFRESMDAILAKVKDQQLSKPGAPAYQTLLFSATIPAWVSEATKRYMRPESLETRCGTSIKVTIRHIAIPSRWQNRSDVVGDVVSAYGCAGGRSIIFVERKQEANELVLNDKLKSMAQVIHGDIAQSQREITLRGFREAKIGVLIATNVAARGLDIPEIDLVINCEPPSDVDTYIHRSGRTGRAGKSGVCVVFFKPNQEYLLTSIEKAAGFKFERPGVPQAKDILSRKIEDTLTQLGSEIDTTVLDYFMPHVDSLIQRCEGNPCKALAACLAHLTNTTTRLPSRSSLTAEEGWVTLLFKTSQPIQHAGFIKALLKRQFPDLSYEDTKGFRMTKDMCGVVVDVKSEKILVKESVSAAPTIELAGVRWESRGGVDLQIAREVPEMVDRDEGANRGYGDYGFRSSRGNDVETCNICYAARFISASYTQLAPTAVPQKTKFLSGVMILLWTIVIAVLSAGSYILLPKYVDYLRREKVKRSMDENASLKRARVNASLPPFADRVATFSSFPVPVALPSSLTGLSHPHQRSAFSDHPAEPPSLTSHQHNGVGKPNRVSDCPRPEVPKTNNSFQPNGNLGWSSVHFPRLSSFGESSTTGSRENIPPVEDSAIKLNQIRERRYLSDSWKGRNMDTALVVSNRKYQHPSPASEAPVGIPQKRRSTVLMEEPDNKLAGNSKQIQRVVGKVQTRGALKSVRLQSPRSGHSVSFAATEEPKPKRQKHSIHSNDYEHSQAKSVQATAIEETHQTMDVDIGDPNPRLTEFEGLKLTTATRKRGRNGTYGVEEATEEEGSGRNLGLREDELGYPAKKPRRGSTPRKRSSEESLLGSAVQEILSNDSNMGDVNAIWTKHTKILFMEKIPSVPSTLVIQKPSVASVMRDDILAVDSANGGGKTVMPATPTPLLTRDRIEKVKQKAFIERAVGQSSLKKYVAGKTIAEKSKDLPEPKHQQNGNVPPNEDQHSKSTGGKLQFINSPSQPTSIGEAKRINTLSPFSAEPVPSIPPPLSGNSLLQGGAQAMVESLGKSLSQVPVAQPFHQTGSSETTSLLSLGGGQLQEPKPLSSGILSQKSTALSSAEIVPSTVIDSKNPQTVTLLPLTSAQLPEVPAASLSSSIQTSAVIQQPVASLIPVFKFGDAPSAGSTTVSMTTSNTSKSLATSSSAANTGSALLPPTTSIQFQFGAGHSSTPSVTGAPLFKFGATVNPAPPAEFGFQMTSSPVLDKTFSLMQPKSSNAPEGVLASGPTNSSLFASSTTTAMGVFNKTDSPQISQSVSTSQFPTSTPPVPTAFTFGALPAHTTALPASVFSLNTGSIPTPTGPVFGFHATAPNPPSTQSPVPFQTAVEPIHANSFAPTSQPLLPLEVTSAPLVAATSAIIFSPFNATVPANSSAFGVSSSASAISTNPFANPHQNQGTGNPFTFGASVTPSMQFTFGPSSSTGFPASTNVPTFGGATGFPVSTNVPTFGGVTGFPAVSAPTQSPSTSFATGSAAPPFSFNFGAASAPQLFNVGSGSSTSSSISGRKIAKLKGRKG
ncbi:Nucleolar RNA helicase 2 [Gonapodya sp. JEL0774]|nr:Nucleolar RNA helicase 2 [Gonapodya sp. JEL0774]